MAGAMRKMAVYLGLVEDDGYDGRGFDPDDDFEPELDPEPERDHRKVLGRVAGVSATRRRSGVDGPSCGASPRDRWLRATDPALTGHERRFDTESMAESQPPKP